ncbi:hypothetical protein LPTSP4_36430 [Leptospira ryugenii]|uniref:Lipoprotein n=1 Tax=Leptospira ryugenii TaxID=1917863 RepID=A0A2P2E5E5_9LEPT|nr:hypothetical protein [Leptospira ryugenii]GBF52105.1 hypothetical protein LPTSP4_36430 [Leptospira ryugenii]
MKFKTLLLIVLTTAFSCSEIENQAECKSGFDYDSANYCFSRKITEEDTDLSELSNNLFIGEILEKNTIFIEPFNFDNLDSSQKLNYLNIYKNINAVAIKNKSAKPISGIFKEHIKSYIPDEFEKSVFYSKPFSKPNFDLLKYNIEEETEVNSIVFGLSGLKFENIDCSNYGKKRPYSKKEYAEAIESLSEDQEIEDRTLDFKKLEETILNARMICSLSNEKSKLKLVLSSYETKGMEYAGTVYLIDFYIKNKLIKTIEKYNYDGPY